MLPMWLQYNMLRTVGWGFAISESTLGLRRRRGYVQIAREHVQQCYLRLGINNVKWCRK